MVSGQGHAVLGFRTAGSPYRIDAATNGRVFSDPMGVMASYSGLPTLFSASSSSYNPAGDPGSSGARRWGDYSFTSLDPTDDMTIWTIQEYCNGTDNYAVRVAKLLAPPPATPGGASSSVPLGQPSANVTITGISVSGSGFFDPGSGFQNRIAASVTGGASGSVTVNSITYQNPTQVSLNLNTTAAANTTYDVTIINPDGQSRTGNRILRSRICDSKSNALSYANADTDSSSFRYSADIHDSLRCDQQPGPWIDAKFCDG